MSKSKVHLSAILLAVIISSHTIAAAPRSDPGNGFFSWVKQIVRHLVPLDLIDPVLPKP